MEAVNVIDTTNFRWVEELSSYNHNVYTDGRQYILEESDDADCWYRYTEVMPKSDGSLEYGEYLGMGNGDEEHPDDFNGIFDISGVHEIYPDWY